MSDSVILHFVHFNAAGYVCGGGQTMLPDWLDWKSIEEKEVFFGYMGGFPSDATQTLITSQGQRKLFPVTDAQREPVNYKIHRRRIDAAEKDVGRICEERGIDRTRKPRNQ